LPDVQIAIGRWDSTKDIIERRLKLHVGCPVFSTSFFEIALQALLSVQAILGIGRNLPTSIDEFISANIQARSNQSTEASLFNW